MKEYGRKPYISDGYYNMMTDTTQKAVREQEDYKQSEMDKPYQSPSYEDMEQFLPITQINRDPVYDLPFDNPWMGTGGQPINTGNMPRGPFSSGKPKGGPTPGHIIPCKAKIGYTGLGMNINQSQNLTVLGSPNRDYNWGLSGGGTLDDFGAGGATYHAPSSNDDCAHNACITLYDGTTPCDTICIAINAVLTSEAAFYIKVCLGEDQCPSGFPAVCTKASVHGGYYYCSGAFKPDLFFNCPGNSTTYGMPDCDVCFAYLGGRTCSEVADPTNCSGFTGGIGMKVDVRTAALIAAGCCPSFV